jgi:hypothetical protein
MSINYAILQNTPKSYEYKLCDTKKILQHRMSINCDDIKITPTSHEYKL